MCNQCLPPAGLEDAGGPVTLPVVVVLVLAAAVGWGPPVDPEAGTLVRPIAINM